ncbi:MAG: hypothetical protein C3F06_02165 [Candidatus Methanoperedenaceae archaeon]|nr:MAG: hypothetical protein C3F06_02165 [Candidatus Methanoperedenaceae archaeon]
MLNRINRQYLAVILALLISLVIRIFLSQYSGYKVDVLDFKLWSQAVYNNGFADFYSSIWSDYPPFYIYILWIVGAFYKLFFSFNIDSTIFTILIKLPANVADIVTAYLIFLIIKKHADFKVAYLGMVFYVFNPGLIYNSAIWGQVDSINTLFILLALFLIVSDKHELAGASMAIAILTKPQSLVIVPFLALLIIRKGNCLRMAKVLISFAIAFLVIVLPFFQKIPLFQLLKIYSSGYSQYAYNSLNAFNFWAFLGFWKSDETAVLFLSYKHWSYILFGLLVIYVALITIESRDNRNIYIASAILFFGFFMLFTRVHERYLFSMFAPLIIAASIDRRLNYIYWISSFTFLFNLHYVLQFLNNDQFIPDGNPYVILTSGINSVLFIYALYCFSDKNPGIIKNILMKIKNLVSGYFHISSYNIYLAIILVVLAILSIYSSTAGIIYAIFLTLFLPGFVFINIFFKDLEMLEKTVLTLFLSVIFSTQLVYWISILIGYSKISILIAGLIFLPAVFFIRIGKPDFGGFRHPAILLSFGVFLIFYIVLSSSVWVFQGDYILLSGSNWQDTPMHLGIIESLNQGNFPPEMPYYSGVRMTYHYFVDFHTAIIEKMSDTFNPRLIVYLNSFFAGLFTLSIFIVANFITKSLSSAVFASIIGVFGGGFSYIRFFQAINSQTWTNFSDLFLQNYVMEWKKFFQIVPVFDVLLQSRPQLIGLPGLALAAYFLYRGLIEKDRKKVLLSGLITGLLLPFHITAFFSTGLIFMLLMSHQLYQRKFWLEGFVYFLLPALISLPFLVDSSNASFLLFAPGWMAPDRSIAGLTLFYLGNLGVPFILSFLFITIQKKHIFFLYSWLLAMFLLPNLVSFTPEQFDMYKFFHYMWIPVAIAAGGVIARLYDKKRYVLVVVLIVMSVLTPFLDAAWNLSVKYPGYSLSEYDAGRWIKENTPQGAVFLEVPGIHSPATQIAGRMQIMGYGTWAYGHGFNIWIRDADIEKTFQGSKEDVLEVAGKYNADYAYIGIEEMRLYPYAKEKFDRNFDVIYSDKKGSVWIYNLKNPAT